MSASLKGVLTLFAVFLIAFIAEAAPGSRCPPAEIIYTYTKKEQCHSDSQCRGGKVCCPTPSRLNSCVEPAFGSQKYGHDKYGSSSSMKQCHSDSQCRGGKVCCPTPSRLNSCVEPAFGSQKYGHDKYGSPSSMSTATGTYCGNVKCSPFERCVNERGRYVCRRS